MNKPDDALSRRTAANLRAFAAPALVTTPIRRVNPALLSSKACFDAFAEQALRNERALEQAAREVMLRDAFAVVPGFTPTDTDLQHMADADAEKHSEGHRHRNVREQRHE